jgi:hypothetical protein
MRGLWRSGPLLLALGIAWTGCNQSSDGPPRAGAGAVAKNADRAKPEAPSKDLKQDQKAEGKSAAVMIPAGTECVLTVEGMA